ncbi:ESX secretion-associated protein EspG, partial [Nocardia abscessus]|uniref:ESX secretion-associated protein EspG n=1 Tax=Nocardia abscessus TaxID=120957 RepID=UPI0024549FB9
MDRVRVNWTLTPDQFALAWSRTDGDRIPYPLAVRLSARDTGELAAQRPALDRWCDQVLDADLEAALRVLAQPDLRIEVYGQRDTAPAPAPRGDGGPRPSAPATAIGQAPQPTARPVRVLGAAAGNIAVVAAQRPGATPDRGGDVRLFAGSSKSLCARVVSMLPENTPGTLARMTAPLAQVAEDSRALVTVPVAGPSTPARIRGGGGGGRRPEGPQAEVRPPPRAAGGLCAGGGGGLPHLRPFPRGRPPPPPPDPGGCR